MLSHHSEQFNLWSYTVGNDHCRNFLLKLSHESYLVYGGMVNNVRRDALMLLLCVCKIKPLS